MTILSTTSPRRKNSGSIFASSALLTAAHLRADDKLGILYFMWREKWETM